MPFNSGFWQSINSQCEGTKLERSYFFAGFVGSCCTCTRRTCQRFCDSTAASQPDTHTSWHRVRSWHSGIMTQSQIITQSQIMTQSGDTEPDHEIQSDHETESDRDTDSVTCFQDFWGGFSNFCFYKKLVHKETWFVSLVPSMGGLTVAPCRLWHMTEQVTPCILWLWQNKKQSHILAMT